MPAQMKISADTSQAKKSILDLGKTVKDVKSSDISIFNASDKKFIRSELNKEIGLMKNKLGENKKLITDLVKEQKNLKKGSDAELKNRHKINQAYKTQKRLAKEISEAQKSSDQLSMRGQMGQGVGKMNKGLGGMLGKAGGLLAAGSLAVGALGLPLAFGSTNQYMAGAGNRTRATGLGIEERTRLSADTIGQAGLTEQELLQRRTRAAAVAGRDAGDEQTVLQQARFERAYGLEEGTMTNSLGTLRSAFGDQANEAQMKLQASILTTGMEDAIGPYLDTAVGLLATINENGMQNTDEMIQALAELSIGERTPEQVARTFQNVDQSVRGASGESNAFLQMAFARGGIGNGTIGATRFAMESGGIMGLDREELEGRGYNDQLLNNMQRSGMFGGMGNRTGAILDQFKESGELGKDQSISDITDVGQMIAMSNLANNVLGTQGMGGYDALQLMEKLQNKEISREQFDEKLKEVKEGKNPQVERLDKINTSLAGQTEVLTAIKENLMESIGQDLAGTGVALQKTDVERVRAQGKMLSAGAGTTQSAAEGAAATMDYISKGKLGKDIFDAFEYVSDGSLKKDVASSFSSAKDSVVSWFTGSDTSKDAPIGVQKDQELKARDQKAEQKQNQEALKKAIRQGAREGTSATKPGSSKTKNVINIKTVSSDGRVTDSTYTGD